VGGGAPGGDGGIGDAGVGGDGTGGQGPRPVRRWKRAAIGVGALVAVAGGSYAYTQVKPIVDARRYASVTYKVPDAPELTARAGEQLFRIDPRRSSLTYEVDEELGGHKTSTATGVTKAVAGDLAINTEDLAKSRVGTVVADIEQFQSGNNLRDSRIRQDFLESHRYPLATFELTEVSGLSGPLVEGKAYDFTLDGNVTVKGTTAKATFDVQATVKDGRFTATATTKAKLSRFDAGPIRVAGLVSTSDDVTLTLKVTAVDPGSTAIASTVEGPERVVAAAGEAPSFGDTIQPILESSCVSCHNSGQMGAHVVTLDTAADAAAISDGIETVTASGYMPPWPASDVGVPLAHKVTLSKAQLSALAAWSAAGGPLDVAPKTKLVPTKQAASLLPRRDQDLRIPTYQGSPTNQNDYRCFVLDPKLTEPMYLTGYTFLADQIEELHHAQVFHISAEQKASSAAVDGADGHTGWSCYGGPELRGRRPDRDPGQPRHRDVGFAGQANLVAGWVPGQTPVIFPLRSGVLLEPGDALVLQIHYHFTDEATPDRSGLSLQLDPVSDDIRQLRVVNPLGPVEIPCAPADKDVPLCDRDAAIADNVKLYGPSGAGNEAGLLALCQHTPEELTKDFDGAVARSSCNLVVPEDGTLVSVLGHMHTLGSTFRLTLDPDTPKAKILLDIPKWSFDWQMNYELADPIEVKAGQPIRIECSWDRRVDPLRSPKYIVFAEGTEDEMCFGTYGLITKRQG
jgi:polyisoprenoid-binding protein YceI